LDCSFVSEEVLAEAFRREWLIGAHVVCPAG
jgi:hypothetical protein